MVLSTSIEIYDFPSSPHSQVGTPKHHGAVVFFCSGCTGWIVLKPSVFFLRHMFYFILIFLQIKNDCCALCAWASVLLKTYCRMRQSSELHPTAKFQGCALTSRHPNLISKIFLFFLSSGPTTPYFQGCRPRTRQRPIRTFQSASVPAQLPRVCTLAIGWLLIGAASAMQALPSARVCWYPVPLWRHLPVTCLL